jgi:HEAT repeat protein
MVTNCRYYQMQTLRPGKRLCVKLVLAIFAIAIVGCGRTIEDRKYISSYTDQLAATIKAMPNSDDAKSALGELIDLVNSDWRFVRCQACCALGEVGNAAVPALPDLMRAAVCGDGFVEEAAVWALAQLGPNAAPAVDLSIKKVENAVENSSEGIETWHAAEALGNIGEAARKSVPTLERALNSNDETLRRKARESLKELTGLDTFNLDEERFHVQ